MSLCEINLNLSSAGRNNKLSQCKYNTRTNKSFGEMRPILAKVSNINRIKQVSINLEDLLPHPSSSDYKILKEHSRSSKERTKNDTEIERSGCLSNNVHTVMEKIKELKLDKCFNINTIRREEEVSMESEQVKLMKKQSQTIRIQEVTENKDAYGNSDLNQLYKVSILEQDCVLLQSKQSCDARRDINSSVGKNSGLDKNQLADTVPIVELEFSDSDNEMIEERRDRDVLNWNLTSTPKNEKNCIPNHIINVSGIEESSALKPVANVIQHHRNVKIGALRGNVSAYENKSDDSRMIIPRGEKYLIFDVPENMSDMHTASKSCVNKANKFPPSPNFRKLIDMKLSREKRKKTISMENPTKRRMLKPNVNGRTRVGHASLFEERLNLNYPQFEFQNRYNNYKLMSSEVKLYLSKQCPNCFFLEMDKQWNMS